MLFLEKQNFAENKQKYKKISNYIKRNISSDLDIHHVGSTAIPNMYGKNIIDILIGAKTNQDFKIISDKLLELGYYTKPYNQDSIYKFFSSRKEETTSGDSHIHLVIISSERYKQFLYLKEYLLHNRDETKKYSNFKLQLIKNGVDDRKKYKKIKSKYVDELIKRAKKNEL